MTVVSGQWSVVRRQLRFVPLTRELLDWALAEERDALTAEMMSGDAAARNLLQGPALCGAMLGRGRVLAAAGLMPQWTGRAVAWMLTSRHATRRELVHAVHHMRQVMDDRQRDPAFRRIEMVVRADHPWCRRFPRALGMAIEGYQRSWDPKGRDALLCARVAE